MTLIFVHVRISVLITPILGVRVRPNVLGHDLGLEHLCQRVRIFLLFAGVVLWPQAVATLLPIVHRLALFTLPWLGLDGFWSDNFLVHGLALLKRWVDATLRAHTGVGGLVNSLEWVFVISLGYARLILTQTGIWLLTRVKQSIIDCLAVVWLKRAAVEGFSRDRALIHLWHLVMIQLRNIVKFREIILFGKKLRLLNLRVLGQPAAFLLPWCLHERWYVTSLEL